ncbi:hypothetical protein HHK36_011674 [Tetracentron sinense]|uniref:Peptidase A1 domain-containing protein n=1 Tax=Tetracentron sinense TaxID=13715 RepID=A0A834ZDA7_TETSI|nr:hypothetical protein HHK36_011674 [Tetracentron sinense]
MAAIPAVHSLCIWLSFTTFLILSCTTTTTTKAKLPRFVLELIHRDSPLSPFYNPNITIYDRNKWALQSSISRHAYLSAHLLNESSNVLRGEVWPDGNGAEFLAKFSIGTPPIEIYTIIDTGSTLLWTQCKPCLQCYWQPGPILDLTKSSTFANTPCNSSYCEYVPMNGCEETPNRCTYMETYADGSYTNGSLASDILTLRSSEGNVTTISNVIFGCGTKNRNTHPGHDTGILGLSDSGYSLISEISSFTQPKFSSCFGNTSNIYAKGHFVLGDGAFIDGYTTPLTIGSNGFYYLTLLGISFGSIKLDIKPGTFDLKPDERGGVIIDSGSKYTLLALDGYAKLRLALYEQLPGDLVLERWSIFVQATEDVFCAAFLPVSPDTFSIIGNLAQQFYNVGYDLVNKEVSFEIIECSVFWIFVAQNLILSWLISKSG